MALRKLALTGKQVMQIALEALVCEATVRRIYQGKGNYNNRERVINAATKLGLPLPEVEVNSVAQ